jgi:outer membrane protein assembly factor BamB
MRGRWFIAGMLSCLLFPLILRCEEPKQTTAGVGGHEDVDTGGDFRLWDGHVSQTRLQLRDLGIAPYDVIPANQSAITALAVHRNGQIYGGTTGEVANLFVFSPRHNIVFPLGTIPGEQSIYHSLVVGHDGQVYFGTTLNVDKEYHPDENLAKGTDWYYRSVGIQIKKDFSGYAGGQLYRYDPSSTQINFLQKNFRINKPCPVTGLGIPVPHEGIYTLLMDRKLDVIYGITYPGANLFRYDIRAGKSEIIAQLNQVTPREEYVPVISKALVQDDKGNVYANTDGGNMVMFSPGTGRVETIGIRIPGMSGRERINGIQAAVLHPDGQIYGGTTDGYLFCFSPDKRKMLNLGKPLMETNIRGLTVGVDGNIYGLGGRKGGVTRLFVYNVTDHAFRDLGMLEVSMVPYYEWKGFLFDSIATAPDGSVFLGNSERRSRLFIYNP